MLFFRIIVFVIVIFPGGLFSQDNTVVINRIELNSPSLAGNLLNDPSGQIIYICLPTDYDKSGKKYPVVYFLPGFGLNADDMMNGTYYNTRMGELYDSLNTNKYINDFILVIANGRNFYAGSFYVNSPVTGNWEDFIVHDLVEYVDNNYRTENNPGGRGIAGHSMGGFGALNIGMKHPDVFGIIYSMSPAIYDDNGLEEHGMFSDSTWVHNFAERNYQFSLMQPAAAFDSLANFMKANQSFNLYFDHAIGAAFSPDTMHVPYINYPFTLENKTLSVDSTILDVYKNALGNNRENIKKYHNNLCELTAVAIECGNEDEFKWIISGSKYFSGN